MIEAFSSLKSQISLLTSRIRTYELDPPVYKMDPCLICPSSRKSLEANQLLLRVLDATNFISTTLERKKQKLSKDTETRELKGINKRIVYDYNFGGDQIKEHAAQVEMVESRNDGVVTDIRMEEVMSGVEYAETLKKSIKVVTDIATTEKSLFENKIK